MLQGDSLVDEINRKLGDQSFYTLRQLISIGIFGSMHSARQAIKQGRLSFIKISPRRCVIQRKTLLDFVSRHSQEGEV